MKVVINTCCGGFSLSYHAQAAYAKRKGFELWFYKPVTKHGKKLIYELIPVTEAVSNTLVFVVKVDCGPAPDNLPSDENLWFSETDIHREDPDLIALVEEFGSYANGYFSNLEVVEIPDGTQYEIQEHNGREWIAEKHRI